ncbi:MAG: ATP-binding protein [Ktedonobacteraceae bacterium]|nr:ATP-binding protein [Ktedonobacteraceae bacterium]
MILYPAVGCLLITQQPGSIPVEILSQSENWFVLHLLSATDLRTLQHANSHYSRDLLALLLNEFIPGHAVMWSAVSSKPYPISLRILSFEHKYTPLDATYEKEGVETFAHQVERCYPPPPEECWEDLFREIIVTDPTFCEDEEDELAGN